jgi:hypothetical protein
MTRIATALTVRTALAVGVSAGLVLAGCGRTGGPQPLPSSTRATAASASVAASVFPVPTRARPSLYSTGSGFPAEYAVPCQGRPGLDQVLALLRTGKVLTAQATATATSGPMCSGDWQYTALDVTGLGPLQVVTRTAGSGLLLVTAGTDVCTTAVTTQAPAGLRAIAHCW